MMGINSASFSGNASWFLQTFTCQHTKVLVISVLIPLILQQQDEQHLPKALTQTLLASVDKGAQVTVGLFCVHP